MTGFTQLGDHEPGTISQMWTCVSDNRLFKGALCADGHKGYAVPIGGVLAYKEHVNISAVGFDIGCGVKAIKLDLPYDKIRGRADVIASDIKKKISFGVGLTYGPSDIDPTRKSAPLFSNDELWKTADVEDLRKMAEGQLGTVGGGNHYVDVLEDTDDGSTWIATHFGSRGLGHKSATKYIALAGGKDGMDVPPVLVHDKSEIGVRYLAAMELSGQYAYAGRDWVLEQVRKIVGGKAVYSVHNHHNFMWRETHFGEDVWVGRKGATPAFPGQAGFVGGSMGDHAYIVEGLESPESRDMLYSTVHGAGRTMSRSQAKKTYTREEMDAWLRREKVHLIGGDLDESPMAYRRLRDVIAYHTGTIFIKHSMRPRIVLMAGKGDGFDPYKD